jgi:hypothetical protein
MSIVNMSLLTDSTSSDSTGTPDAGLPTNVVAGMPDNTDAGVLGNSDAGVLSSSTESCDGGSNCAALWMTIINSDLLSSSDSSGDVTDAGNGLAADAGN